MIPNTLPVESQIPAISYKDPLGLNGHLFLAGLPLLSA